MDGANSRLLTILTILTYLPTPPIVSLCTCFLRVFLGATSGPSNRCFRSSPEDDGTWMMLPCRPKWVFPTSFGGKPPGCLQNSPGPQVGCTPRLEACEVVRATAHHPWPANDGQKATTPQSW
ncbi:hypothetical protein LX32DRAFT_330922 [Colletotrichum zoysiae]|uniref:Uncharacterized protein n=1 Tax=Colletotrichum zoysiae TaxID=1216348 RepID=A0AAD9HJT0_9PEZI|nr:hypothetical protein LX32DRAFT_330922 [Colletotrichum zoysiae]